MDRQRNTAARARHVRMNRSKNPHVSFDRFAYECESAGLRAVEHHYSHWQIIGDGLKVDFWPTAKDGPKYLVIGRDKRAIRGGYKQAIEAAINRQERHAVTGTSPDELPKLRRVAEVAIDYLKFDGRLLDQMSHEQAEACLQLLIALREAGYRMKSP